MKPHELIDALVKRAGGSLPVAKAMGAPGFQPTLHKIAAGQVEAPQRSSAERIAKHFGIPVDAVYDERVATRVWKERFEALAANDIKLSIADGWPQEAPPLHQGVAQPVSLYDIKMLPTVTWEAIMKGDELPAVFEMLAPDEALMPEVRAGQKIKVTLGDRPRANDGILVQDSAGNYYMRRYREGRAGTWTAASNNPGFEPLDPGRDSLTIIGVVSIERRLSE
jgi:hypothetical protein